MPGHPPHEQRKNSVVNEVKPPSQDRGRTQCGLGAGLFAVLVSVAAPVWARPAPELLPPPGGVRGAADPVALRVPELQGAMLSRLTLELDGMDVTAMLARRGEVLTFRPVEPLATGAHELRLVEYAPNGDILELGRWTLEIRFSPSLREAGFEAETSLNAVHRLAGSGLGEPPPPRGVLEGASTLAGHAADADWQVQGNADVLFHSEAQELPRGRGPVDAGEFLFQGRRAGWNVRAGHHAPVPDGLIVQEFSRRGVSAGYTGTGGTWSASAFALRTQEITGLTGGLGVDRSDERTAGVVVAARPLPRSPRALSFSAVYLSGGDPGQTGEGVGGEPETGSRGEAAAVAGEALVLQERLQLRGELARTRYDYDGPGPLPAESDDGLAVLLGYTPWRERPLRGEPASLRLGLEHRRLGTFFRSPANPGAVADRNMVRGFLEFNWNGIDLQAGAGRETDNVNGLVLLPRVATRQVTFDLAYAPPDQEATGDVPLPWYGQPAFSLSAVDLSQRVVNAGAGLMPGDLRDTRNVTLSASFTYPAWSWSLSHSVGRDDDLSGQSADTRNAATEATLDLQSDAGLTLALTVQHARSEDRDAGVEAVTDTAGLELGYALSERVQAGLTLALNRERSSDDSVNARTVDIGGTLAWTVQEAGGGQPGLQVSVEGQRREQVDRVDPVNDVTSTQVFLRLTVSWQAGS